MEGGARAPTSSGRHTPKATLGYEVKRKPIWVGAAVIHRGSGVVRKLRNTVGAWLADGGRRPSQAADGQGLGAGDRPAGSDPRLLAHGLPSLPLKLLLAGGSCGEGDALGVQEVQQLPRGHVDALLLQLGL